ncbi:glycosyltransferase family protein [Arthrobacter sp. Sr24]
MTMIVFPMVGKSSRFFDAGYDVPKFMLETPNGNVFRRAVLSFIDYFEHERFVFITRTDFDTPVWVHEELVSMGVKNFSIVPLEGDTLGQADTVRQGILDIPDLGEPLIIFNIDTFRHDFTFPDAPLLDGNWLEVFEGEGTHWSFVEPGPNYSVIRTTEKERISDLCSNGLYAFASQSEFVELVNSAISSNEFIKGEIYVAPLYNKLIQSHIPVHYREVSLDFITFCGTPDEYRAIL